MSNFSAWLQSKFNVPQVNLIEHPAAAVAAITPVLAALAPSSPINAVLADITAVTGIAPSTAAATPPVALPALSTLEEKALTGLIGWAISEAEQSVEDVATQEGASPATAQTIGKVLGAKFLIPALTAAEGLVARDAPGLSGVFDAGVTAAEATV